MPVSLKVEVPIAKDGLAAAANIKVAIAATAAGLKPEISEDGKPWTPQSIFGLWFHLLTIASQVPSSHHHLCQHYSF